MQRRSEACRGYVNFPVNSEEYKNSNEGGMYVQLVVCEKDDVEWDDRWMLCCGGGCTIIMGESFLGDDVHHCLTEDELFQGPPEGASHEEISAWANGLNRRNFGPAGNFHFPDLYQEDAEEAKRIKEFYGRIGDLLSIDYHAVVTMGSTGWSGYSEKNGSWLCTYDDLTAEGKALYDSLKQLYGDTCQLYLQTWLDT